VAAGADTAGGPDGAAGRGDRTTTACPARDEGQIQDAGQALGQAAAQVLRLVAEGVERRAALRRVASSTGVPRREIYAELVRRRSGALKGGSEEE
jgi:hypothetical protein